MKHCIGVNTQTNWLIDINLGVHCRILRIVEFDLKLLDYSKRPTIGTWVAKTTLNSVNSVFIEQPVLSYKTKWKVWKNNGLYAPISFL